MSREIYMPVQSRLLIDDSLSSFAPFYRSIVGNKSFPAEYCVLSAVSSISVENFEQNMTKSKSKSKKSDKGKEGNNLSNTSDSRPPSSCDIRPPTPAIQSPVNSSSRLPKPWFQSEILNMMYAFGDSRKPAAESATLIEEIVHSQMASLVVRAAEVTNMRGGRFMSVEDIIFLMRKDKEKLKRLIKYLNFKDVKSKSQKQTSQDDDEVLEASVGEIKGSKRRKVCYDFISSIDQTGDLVALFDDDDIDEIKQERNERAERLSRTLDPQQYMEFTECRQANFNKKAGKFKEWLDCASLIDMKPNTPVMDVFSFLAYETVGQLVDLALLVKKDLQGGDVMMQVMPPVSILSESQSSVVAPGSTTSTPSTPNHTPPGTPTTPTTPFLPSPTTSATSSTSSSVQNSSSASKPKSKKRKAKGSAASLSYSSGDCIQPQHIHEAIRRYNHFIGPMAPFSAHVKPAPGYRTLCC